MIGCAVVWMIWKFRNLVVFENSRGSCLELVEGVKVVSWKWWTARTILLLGFTMNGDLNLVSAFCTLQENKHFATVKIALCNG
jgi:hypothetical protein